MTRMLHTSHIESGKLAECITEPEVYQTEEPDMSRSAEVFRRVMVWVNSKACRGAPWGRIARLIAAQSVVCPSAIEFKSFRQIQRDTRGRITKSHLAQLAQDFRKDFGIK